MSNYKLISVESRKGGVGKTTAALNLGYLLKEKYHVLLLDIDVTGTSIRAIQESRFWINDTYLLTDNTGNPINLLQYYSNSYLRGDSMFSFTSLQEKDGVVVKENAINVMASELYGEDASLLYDPSLLLDNIHVYWLTRMITSICEDFSRCFDDEKSSVIILDNSPGFVGIGKAVHDILTDVGPEQAKFLTVASLDIQDLESSLKSVYLLHQEYLDKYNGARFPETQKGDEDFYSRVKLSGSADFSYYRENHEEVQLNYYQGLIINKVAKNIVEGRTRYNYRRSLTPKLEVIYNSLYGNRIKDYLVPFDNVLLTQFYGVFEEKANSQKKNLSTLKKRLATIDGQLRLLEDLDAESLPYDLLRRANGLDRTVDMLKGALIASGYEVIASKFNQEWSPTSPLRTLLDNLKEVGIASEGFELYFPKRERTEKEMSYFDRITDKALQYATINQELVWFASAVAAVTCELSFCYSNKFLWDVNMVWRDGMAWAGDKGKWADTVNVVLLDWMDRIVERYVSHDSNKYLASFVISEDASMYNNILRELYNNDGFVESFKTCVSRLMDIVPDMRTMLNLMRAITVYNEGSYSVDVDYVPFLNHKIIDKRYDYGLAKEMMFRELRDANYMDAYRDVLGNVLANWKI